MTISLRMVCGNCGSEDVTVDASARWNIDRQIWETDCPHDHGTCQACGAEGDHVVKSEPVNIERRRVLLQHAPAMWAAICEHWMRGGQMFLNGQLYELAPRIQQELNKAGPEAPLEDHK